MQCGTLTVGVSVFSLLTIRYSLRLSHTPLLGEEIARRGGFFHEALLDRARGAEEVALGEGDVEVERFEHEVFALNAFGDEIDAVAREHRRHIRRRDLAHDRGLRTAR